MEPYRIVASSFEDDLMERIVAAAMSLTAEHRAQLGRSGSTSLHVPDCFSLKYVFELDSEGTVWVSVKREERA